MVSRRDEPAARSTGISRAKGNSEASSNTSLHSAGRISSIAQLRCPSAQLIGFEFGREVSGFLSYSTVAVPAAPETEDARARAIAERLPHCEAPPREGADSNGNSHYGLTEQGLAQTMGSGAAGCQERQANPGIALRSKLTSSTLGDYTRPILVTGVTRTECPSRWLNVLGAADASIPPAGRPADPGSSTCAPADSRRSRPARRATTECPP